MGTFKQRRNDIKLLTILAEAFGKNELVWNHHESTRGDGRMIPRTRSYRALPCILALGRKYIWKSLSPHLGTRHL